jgi:hypothetical protein
VTAVSDAADAVDEQEALLESLWRPHPGQTAIMHHEARFRIVACGRRWGKSEMAAHEALEFALEHAGSTVWWVAPTYEQANSYGFDKIKPLLSPDITAETPKRSKPRQIALVNGSTISFRSAEREDSLRGGGVDFLVVDEAGSVPDRAFVEELRPTLSDTQGDLLAIGTPRYRNWFKEWFDRGQSGEYPDVASWQAPSKQNPHVPDEEVESAKNDVPEREFRREYRAEFIDETGGVFTDLESRVLADYDPERVSGEGPYTVGVDFARSDDYTVIIALDEDGRLVHFDRVRGAGWPEIQRRIESVAEEYAGTVYLDATRDNKIVADLEQAGVSVEPVNFGGGTKQDLIQNLITTVEQGELTLPNMDPLVHELEVFEYEETSAGNTRYSAPDGFKDDCVDALALAARGLSESTGVATARATFGETSDSDDGETTVGDILPDPTRSDFGRRY